MESKNIKPRILDALDVIGKPATETMTTEIPTATPKSPGYGDIYEGIVAQKRSMDNAIAEYVLRILDGDSVYSAMISARSALQKVLVDMDMSGKKCN